MHQPNHQPPPYPNDQNGNAAPVYVAVPQATAQPTGQEGDKSGIDIKLLLAAFRRCWLTSILLGLFAGGGVAAAAWQLLPKTYTSSSEFLVQPNRKIVYDSRATGEDRVRIETYKQTLRREATFPSVLDAVLRDEDVRNCPTIRKELDPEKWLKQNIAISSPATQFLQISMTGSNPNDVFHIVSAFTKAFQDQILGRERDRRNQSLKIQKVILSDTEEELESELKKLRAEDKRLAANSEAANIEFEKIMNRQLNFEKLIGEIDLKILDEQFRLQLVKEEKAKAANQKPAETDSEEMDPDDKDSEGKVVDALEEEIEVPDEVIESQIVSDPEYEKLYSTFLKAKNTFKLYESKFQANHPRIAEKKKAYNEAQLAFETFQQVQKPIVRERIIGEIKKQRERQKAEWLREQERLAKLANGEAVSGFGPGKESIRPEVALANKIRTLESKRELYLAQLVDLENHSRELTVGLVDREVLAEKVSKLQKHASFLADRVHAREVEMENTPEAVTIRREPAMPKSADVDSRAKLAALGGFGMFGAVVLLIVFREHTHRRLSSSTDLNESLGLSLIGNVPVIPRALTSKTKKISDNRAEFWHSALVESFDAARAMLVRNAEVFSMRAVMITGAVGGEGKTTLSCHMATSLARSGRRTLLIDCDLRRPSVHKVFGIENDVGLCEVLRETASLNDCYFEAQDNLTVLPAGRVNQQVLNTLSTDRFREIIQKARGSFDFVIVDSSPILPVADGLLISQHCDGVLFSIRRDVSQVHSVGSTVEKFRMLGVPIIGAVAIGLDRPGNSQGYGGSYYNQYPYSYGRANYATSTN